MDISQRLTWICLKNTIAYVRLGHSKRSTLACEWINFYKCLRELKLPGDCIQLFILLKRYLYFSLSSQKKSQRIIHLESDFLL